MSLGVALTVAMGVVLLPRVKAGQRSIVPDPFERVAFLIGRSEGTAEGQRGRERTWCTLQTRSRRSSSSLRAASPFDVYSRGRLKRVR